MKNNSNNVFEFAANTLTINGTAYPVEYSINPTGDVYAFVTAKNEDGEQVQMRVRIPATDDRHADALKAAKEERAQREQAKAAQEQAQTAQGASKPAFDDTRRVVKPRRPQPAGLAAYWEKRRREKQAVQEQAQPEEQAQTVEQAQPVEQAQTAQADAKQTRGPVPEKTFIGAEIKGKGWKIFFDGDHARTRVIFAKQPSKAAREAVEKAGFYWSPVLESWNKKLTFKAFRAAQTLAGELKAICG